MKRVVISIVALQFLILGVATAQTAKECTLCVGLVTDAQTGATSPVPILLRLTENDLATKGTWVDSLAVEHRKKVAIVVDVALDGDGEPLVEVEQRTRSIVEWGKLHGPFESIGITITNADAGTAAYGVKRLAVMAQGLEIAGRISIAIRAPEELVPLFESGANAYFDVVVAPGQNITSIAAWLLEKDPSKKIYGTVAAEAPNVLFDLATALSSGAVRAYLDAPNLPATYAALKNFNEALRGDWAFDSTARTATLDSAGATLESPVLTFVRGEDLRSMIIPRGLAAGAMIVALPSDDYVRPRRIAASGEREMTDTGKKGGKLLVGLQPVKEPFAIVVDRAEARQTNVTKEAIDVATRRGITVEEIIRNHQAYDAYQASIEPRYIAHNATKLRFAVGAGGEAVEATIAGDYFSEPGVRADWVWKDFFINGVRWKYGRIPELPIIQPEKVSQLPLDIHLTNEYRYHLVGERKLLGYDTYEVRFDPPANAPDELPLYRGTVWIDARSWARIRISMVQLNLTGEVLSNEERVDFQPFARDSGQPLAVDQVVSRDPKSVLWLPYDVSAQQVVSAAGRTTPVLRATTFTQFRIDPSEFTNLVQAALASDARMVRETEAGLRYLEKRGSGERVVKEGYDTSRLFMLGGIHHDAGLEFPVVPLGGIDYFNFNLFKRGIQANVFFAGVIVAANATHPNVANTRTNVGADFLGIAIPFENTMYRGGAEAPGESVKVLPTSLTLRAGHPIFTFGKIDVSFSTTHLTYQRGEETAAQFAVPDDTFVLSPAIHAEYTRWGYSMSMFYDYNRRTSWSPWGNLAEYSDEQRSFVRYGGSFGKSFYLPRFQRIGVDVNYLGGQRLDRFSQYELGFFGAQRVHGIKSGSVRAERAIIGHLSYGLVFSDQFRLETFYDHGLIDDRSAGLRREPFQGVGIAGQTVGPYGTLLRLDIGKTIGRNRQDGFVANVVFLKLF